MFESITPDAGLDGLSRAVRLFIAVAALSALAALLQLTTFAPEEASHTAAAFVLAAFSSALAYGTARGIEAQRPWAKRLAYVQGVLFLFNFPVGTVVGMLVLVYVYRASKAGLFIRTAQHAV